MTISAFSKNGNPLVHFPLIQSNPDSRTLCMPDNRIILNFGLMNFRFTLIVNVTSYDLGIDLDMLKVQYLS